MAASGRHGDRHHARLIRTAFFHDLPHRRHRHGLGIVLRRVARDDSRDHRRDGPGPILRLLDRLHHGLVVHLRLHLRHRHHLDPRHGLIHRLLPGNVVRHRARDLHDLRDRPLDRDGLRPVLDLVIRLRLRHGHLLGHRPGHLDRPGAVFRPVLDLGRRHGLLFRHPSDDRDGLRLILGPVTRLHLRHRHLDAFRVVDRLVDDLVPRLVGRRRPSRRLARRHRRPWPEAVCGCQAAPATGFAGDATSSMTPMMTTQIDLRRSIGASSIRLSHQPNPVFAHDPLLQTARPGPQNPKRFPKPFKLSKRPTLSGHPP